MFFFSGSFKNIYLFYLVFCSLIMLCFGRDLFSIYVSLDIQNFKVTVDQNLWSSPPSPAPCPLLLNTKLKERSFLYFFHSCLRAKVNRALGSITMNKASGGDEIPVELLQILKDAYWMLQYASKLENSAVAIGLEKVSFYSSP